MRQGADRIGDEIVVLGTSGSTHPARHRHRSRARRHADGSVLESSYHPGQKCLRRSRLLWPLYGVVEGAVIVIATSVNSFHPTTSQQF